MFNERTNGKRAKEKWVGRGESKRTLIPLRGDILHTSEQCKPPVHVSVVVRVHRRSHVLFPAKQIMVPNFCRGMCFTSAALVAFVWMLPTGTVTQRTPYVTRRQIHCKEGYTIRQMAKTLSFRCPERPPVIRGPCHTWPCATDGHVTC